MVPGAPEEIRRALKDLLIEYSDVWFEAVNPGTCTNGEAQLEAAGRPFKSKLRPMSDEVSKECKKQIDTLLEANLLQPSKSLLWDYLRFAAGEKYFLSFDVVSGFWHLPLSFGLKTAPAEFQRTMDNSLKNMEKREKWLAIVSTADALKSTRKRCKQS
eukprot:GHVS01061239.1.p2 GENE.GHVS01061239.1~~GHVS01061239.1.p2  ORF type:complete len:158 (-),score=12.63 GHVS01061239.1:1122-1595(-)